LKNIFKILFSFRLTASLLVILALSIAAATIIENDFGSSTARAHVYNATWFEMLFLLATINLLGNMIRHRVYRKGKLSILIFHLAFILILCGAGITRYTGFTGILHIREGTSSSLVLSDEAFLNMQILSGEGTAQANRKVYLSGIRNPGKLLKIRNKDGKVSVHYLDHIVDARPLLEPSPKGRAALLLVSSGNAGREYHVLYDSESRWISGHIFHFNRDADDGVSVYNRNDSLFFKAPFPVTIFSMAASTRDTLVPDEEQMLLPMTVYGFGTTDLVMSDFFSRGSVLAVKVKEGEASGKTALSLRLKSGGQEKDITLWGGEGIPGQPRQVTLGDKELFISYGSLARVLPFSLHLDDFILERYPGSESPSSFESQVVLDDPARNIRAPYRIYMNNILNYRGYRFFQSSYDQDEMGTVLSVNRDRWGTLVSYAGYFLLFLGIIFSLFNPGSRFRTVGRQLGSSRAARTVIAILLITAVAHIAPRKVKASADNLKHEIPAGHSRSFGQLLVQDHQGRIKPVNTFASEALRKISRKQRIDGASPEEVILGMTTDPTYWQNIPMIRISHAGVKEILGIEGNNASFLDFFAEGENPYRISEHVGNAHRTRASDRSKFDTEILRVDERVNICYMIYTGDILRILPDRDDPGQTWHSPTTIHAVYSGEDSLFATNITQLYLEAVGSGKETGDWSLAEEYLGYIKLFQERMGGSIIPSRLKQKAEIAYNRIGIFERLARFYLSIGMLLLVIQLVNVLGSRSRFTWLRRVMVIHLLAAFGMHSLGLAVRWYVSGYAPWSNGYESLIYIAWASMLAGAVFSRRTPTPLAVTAVLSWMILHTAHLSWMDPQMTPLVPVLKSYWLTIHVAVIASSYGFLGLAALLGFLNLALMGLQRSSNRENVAESIRSLSGISEMTIIAGLGLLTIGTFLGGIWANESWGRYWAWDPKESWALITILVYAFIAHMRFVPGLKHGYTFNLAALLGFASVLMTYFGVNYYLSGMHSYAAGDPVPVPRFVWYTLALIALTALGAYRGVKKHGLEIE